MTYSDKYGEFFGVLTERGDVAVLHVEDGLAATRLDASVYPILGNGRSSDFSTRYDHPQGIVLSVEDARKLGIEIDQ